MGEKVNLDFILRVINERVIGTLKKSIGTLHNETIGYDRALRSVSKAEFASGQTMQAAAVAANRNGDMTRGYGLALSTVNKQQFRGERTTQNLTKASKGLGQRLGKLSGSYRRLIMPMLSLMFLGMAMQRIFAGMLQPALKFAGVFDVLSIILTILFLPVAMLVLDVLLWLLGVVSSLSPEVKLFIGILAILGFIFFGLLMIVGQLGLGLLGFAMLIFNIVLAIAMLGGSTTVVGAVAGAIGALGGIVLWVIGIFLLLAVIAFIILIGLLAGWEYTIKAIQDELDGWGKFLDNIIEGARLAFEGLLEFDIIKMCKGMALMTVAVFNKMFETLVMLPFNLAVAFLVGMSRIIGWLIDVLVPGWKEAWGEIKSFVKGIIDWIAEKLNWLLDSMQHVMNVYAGITGEEATQIKPIGEAPAMKAGGGEAVLQKKIGAGDILNYMINDPSMEIHISEMSSEMDKEKLMNEIKEAWYNEMRREMGLDV